MKNCFQTSGISMLDHGNSVWQYTQKIIHYLDSGIKDNDLILPDWMIKYRIQFRQKLFSLNIIEEYTTYHDCGKALCRIIDDNGKQHFPAHAEVSHHIWLQVGGNEQAAQLMKLDMVMHTIKANQVADIAIRDQCITLLIVALAEIHSNAEMFGGFQSTSFKIKYKHLNQRGKAITQLLFGGI